MFDIEMGFFFSFILFFFFFLKARAENLTEGTCTACGLAANFLEYLFLCPLDGSFHASKHRRSDFTSQLDRDMMHICRHAHEWVEVNIAICRDCHLSFDAFF